MKEVYLCEQGERLSLGYEAADSVVLPGVF